MYGDDELGKDERGAPYTLLRRIAISVFLWGFTAVVIVIGTLLAASRRLGLRSTPSRDD